MFPSFPSIFLGVFQYILSYTLTTHEYCPVTFKQNNPMLFLMSLNISKKVLPAYELMAISLTIVYLSCFTVSPSL